MLAVSTSYPQIKCSNDNTLQPTVLDYAEVQIMSKKRETQTLNTLALGLCFGIALGAILNNIVLGLCLGLVFDAALEHRNKDTVRKQ